MKCPLHFFCVAWLMNPGIDMDVVSTVSRFAEQTWTRSFAPPRISPAFPAFLSHSRKLSSQVMSLRGCRLGRPPFGPTLAPPPCSCVLTCTRAWPGSVGLPSPGFSPATCSRRGWATLTFHFPQEMKVAPLVPCLCMAANAIRDKTSDGYSPRR